MDHHLVKPQNISTAQHLSAPRLRFRSGFAVQNVLASANFCRVAQQVEDANRNGKLGPFWDEIRWNVTAAIVLSATALEANINEHLLDEECLPSLGDAAKQVVIQLLESQSVLDKYQQVARLHLGSQFDEGVEPYQSAKALVRLRNAIVHFMPEWTDEQTMHAKIGQMLDGRFAPSPFFASSEPLFPDRCMSADCARWATTSALKFTQDFHHRCDTKSRFTDKHVARISSMLSNGA